MGATSSPRATSWAPEWCLLYSGHSRILKDGIFDPIMPSETQKMFNAGPGTSPFPFHLDEYPNSLGVAGVKVNIIRDVAPPPKGWRWSILDRSFRTMINHLMEKPYHGGITMEEAYWRTLFADCWKPFAQTGINTPGSTFSKLSSEIPGICHIPPVSFEEETQLIASFPKLSTSILHDRSFFVSDDGFIGLGPADVKVGDIVVILMGGRVPFILREVLGAYLLVGERYDPDSNNSKMALMLLVATYTVSCKAR